MMQKGDFTVDLRLLLISALAIVAGAVCTFVAVVLLWLIALFTNLFYLLPAMLQKGEVDLRLLLVTSLEKLPSPGDNTLGWMAILVPVVGGLIIGLMARFGSDRIRGHGIPEAIEAILIGQSRMQPRVAILKPLSSAISIGSGGPFGAEGPIIMTGGACGSIIGQLFKLTAAERKTLLVAGAAGGMAATFATPVAAVLLAVELLLFEWKPRSFVPVALACATAGLLRVYLLGAGPLFEVPPHNEVGMSVLLCSVVVGLLAGMLALTLTLAVYTMEDLFHRLPIHWMWWPALGGLVVGIGGYFEPRALGVGYDVIRDILAGKIILQVLIPLIIVKCVIWATSLGSGTSGGVLAPLLMMGGALGALMSYWLPGRDGHPDPGLWALVSMAAVLGGTMRCPLTGAIFALELTHDLVPLPALLLGCVTAYGFTALVMKRSILTEKVARRGFHVSREYSVDPLERLSIGDVMSQEVITIPAWMPVRQLLQEYFLGGSKTRHQGYPVIDKAGDLVGVLTRTNLLTEWLQMASGGADKAALLDFVIAYDLLHREPVVAFPWESCRTAAERMAHSGVGRLPVVSPDDPSKVIGIVTRSDLLKARARMLEEESRRESFLVPGQKTGAG
jgi:H+/Cl- antiporter ClcA/CBS domain-containing protein